MIGRTGIPRTETPQTFTKAKDLQMEGGLCSSLLFLWCFPPIFQESVFHMSDYGAIRLKKYTYKTKIFAFFVLSVKRFTGKSKQSCNCQRGNTELEELISGFKVNRSCVICTEVYNLKKCFQWYRFGSTLKSINYLYSWTALLYKKCLIRQLL